jgi:hypothetical protein
METARAAAATGVAAEPASALGIALVLTDAGHDPVQVGPGA